MDLEAEELQIARQRSAQVFRFLEAFNQLRNPVRRQIREQPWVLWLRQLPDHPSIRRSEIKDEAFDEEAESELNGTGARSTQDFVLGVSRPQLTSSPSPPSELLDWLVDGWGNPAGNAEVKPHLEVTDAQRGTAIVRFEDDPERPRLLGDWQLVREEWARSEKPARAAMGVFERLYELHAEMERESERVELVLGDGILNWRRPEGGIHHPIILQRLQLEFEPEIPAFNLRETERPVELYSALFRSISEVDGRVVGNLRDEVERAGYHPLAEDSTSAFLQRLAVQLSPRGEFTGEGEPQGEEDYPRIGRDPVIFLRKRMLGFATAIEAILDDLPTREDLSPSLLRVVGIETSPPNEAKAPGSTVAIQEDEQILFTKPANSEQWQIARRLEDHGSVLVQGPPGTGKTHTIPN